MRQTAHPQRAGVSGPRRPAAGPRHSLENVKSPVQTGRRGAGQSVPAQFAAPVCQGFLWIRKNLSKLADLLGHSSIETTRIYIMESGDEHQKLLERMHLLL